MNDVVGYNWMMLVVAWLVIGMFLLALAQAA